MFFLIYFMCVTIHESVYVKEVGRVRGRGRGGGRLQDNTRGSVWVGKGGGGEGGGGKKMGR